MTKVKIRVRNQIKHPNKFNRLVVYDKEEERRSKYQSDVRGRAGS